MADHRKQIVEMNVTRLVSDIRQVARDMPLSQNITLRMAIFRIADEVWNLYSGSIKPMIDEIPAEPLASENRQASSQAQAQPQSSQQPAAQREAFIKHLEHASSVVQTWPAWKQQVLGGTAAQQPEPAE